ncbi:hypothetical protein OIU85_010868 [Salix viminalis]|uniref:Uncharacterized protein n=1 Tax=Salix viminalis TaxID=40686 RepID=A0A9Q0NRL3_SALVM|nr:hypothetical protein OIU85_010868 [Salix viminalis]
MPSSANSLNRNGYGVKKAHPFGVFSTGEAAVEEEKAENPSGDWLVTCNFMEVVTGLYIFLTPISAHGAAIQPLLDSTFALLHKPTGHL